MRAALSALGAGLLFGAGLLISGMTDPARVRAFLDFAGAWNPSLAGVMGAAIAVHATALWLERRRLHVPAPRARIEGRTLLGAAVFGVGWGLAGYCPGPAVVLLGATSLGAAAGAAWIFFAAMVLGVVVGDAAAPARIQADPDEAPSC
jgi:uncharacterized membrane protein YedE/YeeE